MKNSVIFLFAIFFSFSLSAQQDDINFHSFVVKDIEGNDYKFSQLKGKKVLVVNTASKCGLTPQYEMLQDLYEQYGGDDFAIIGFPANNFKNQEPGTNNEIKEFCTKEYGVTFPMMAKISVKGDDIHPLYEWLTIKKNNGIVDADVTWNFQKFMINKDGSLFGFALPKTKPFDEKIIQWIKE